MRSVEAAAVICALVVAGHAAAAEQLIAGKKLRSGTSILFASKDPAILPPAPDGPDDPTLNDGWTYEIFAGASLSSGYDVPAAAWSRNAAGTRFKYVDKLASSAVRVAVIKPGLLKVKVQVGGLPFGAGEPIGIALGGGTTRYCAAFAPDTWIVTGPGDRFVAKDAPAPTACPTAATTTTVASTTSTSSVTSSTLLLQCTGGAPFPTCDGSCPPGAVCAPDVDSFALCKCIFDSAPCGETYPVCGGVCGEGGTCRQTGVVPWGACTCEPPGVLCTDGPYPTCGAACPAGASCFPTIVHILSQPYPQCGCGSAAPCGSGGLACPAGQACSNLGGIQTCVPS